MKLLFFLKTLWEQPDKAALTKTWLLEDDNLAEQELQDYQLID